MFVLLNVLIGLAELVCVAGIVVSLLIDIRKKKDGEYTNKDKKETLFIVPLLVMFSVGVAFLHIKTIEDHNIFNDLPMVSFTDVRIVDFDHNKITYVYVRDGEIEKGTKFIEDVKIGQALKVTKKKKVDLLFHPEHREELYVTEEILDKLDLIKE